MTALARRLPAALILVTALALGLVASACSPVRRTFVRPDYDAAYRTQVLRLVAVTSPLPDGRDDVGRMWSLMARRYVNHHRDFIVKGDRAAEALPADLCGEGLEGVLHLAPAVRLKGDAAEVEVTGRLWRCGDETLLWEAEVGSTWPVSDPNLVELTEQYVQELGEGVRPYVAPSFQLLRAALDTLPRPELATDDDVMEKIELGE